MTNDAVAAFAGDNADGAAAESRLAAALGGWDGSRAGIVGRRDGTIAGTGAAASPPKLLFVAVGRNDKCGVGRTCLWSVKLQGFYVGRGSS